MARPRIPIDEEQVEKLARLGASNVDIAYVVGCSENVIRARFGETVEKGKATRRNTLRKWQWKSAQSGNVAMQIWLGKQYLGQTEKVETRSEVTTTISPQQQRAMLSNPRALQLACDLDAEIGKPSANGDAAGDDPGRVRHPDE